MTNVKEHFVGIDVAKDWFDVAVLGEKHMMQFANTKKGIAELVRRMSQLQPRLFVGKSEERKRLSALVGWRKQMNDMLQAEKNRLRRQSGAIRSSLERVIVCLEAELQQMDQEIRTLIQ